MGAAGNTIVNLAYRKRLDLNKKDQKVLHLNQSPEKQATQLSSTLQSSGQNQIFSRSETKNMPSHNSYLSPVK